jgi:hypothetical protein
MIHDGRNEFQEKKVQDYFKFSIINPKFNKTFYYLKKIFPFKDITSLENYDFLLSQEMKFLQLIVDCPREEVMSAWIK